MFNRLRARLTIVCAVSTGLVLIGMAVASYHFSARQLQSQWQESFQSDLNNLFFYLRGQNAIDHAWLSQTESSSGLWIRIESISGPFQFTTQNPRRAEITALAAEEALAAHQFNYLTPPSGTLHPDTCLFLLDTADGSFRAAAASVPVGGTHWVGVILLKDRAGELRQIINLRLTFIFCVIIALGCLAAVAWLFTAWAVKPVKEGQKKQSEFVSAASHELRSPLAVMQASAGAIKNAPPDKARHFAEKIERECGRLARLTGDLLRLAGSDNHRWAMAFSQAEPETLALSTGERFEELAAARGIHLSVRLPEEPLPLIRCDAERVGQALTIFLDNALSYTPEGGSIRLSAEKSRRGVRFSVADSGPGIPDSEKEKVFDRFYRGDASRTDKEHYGLGLSVAREIAGLHRGSITVTDASEGGAQFNLSLPVLHSTGKK